MPTQVAGRDITLVGASVEVKDNTKLRAGDDIVAKSSLAYVKIDSGASLATTAPVVGNDSETLPNFPTVFGVGNLLGSNVVIQAASTALVAGPVTSATDYRVRGTVVTLGDGLTPITQSARGLVDILANLGAVNLSLDAPGGTGGRLISNFGGGNTAGGGRADGARGDCRSTARRQPCRRSGSFSSQRSGNATIRRSQQPGVSVTADPAGLGDVTLASVNGGTVAISAPAAIIVPTVTSSGTVTVLGTTAVVAANDIATIGSVATPMLVTISDNGVLDHPAATITLMAGRGVTAQTNVVGFGTINNLKLITDTGNARLIDTPHSVAKTATILVESQTGRATIDTAYAGTIAVAGPPDWIGRRSHRSRPCRDVVDRHRTDRAGSQSGILCPGHCR